MTDRNEQRGEHRQGGDGIECPRCGCAWVPVLWTRDRAGIRVRRRECRHCGRRFVTREIAITPDDQDLR